MKLIHTIFSIFFISTIFAQKSTFSDYKICGMSHSQIILQLQDMQRSATILKIDNQNYLSIEDSVFLYSVAESENLIYYTEKLSEIKSLKAKQLLNKLKTINPNLLNIVEKGNDSKIVVQDGATFEVELFEGDCKIVYSSYSPDVYIKNEYPHFKERVKLLEVYEGLHSVFYNKEFNQLKSADTIYVVYDKSEKIKNLSVKQIKNRNLETYSFLFTDGKNLILRKFIDKKITVNKKSLLDKNIVDLNIVNKYRFKAMVDILFEKKAIYFINKNELCKKNKIILYTAYLFNLP